MSAKSLIYTFRLLYEGKGEMSQLQSDLRSMKKIDAYSALMNSFRKTNEQLVAAKRNMRELKRHAADARVDPGTLASYQQAAGLVNTLRDKVSGLPTIIIDYNKQYSLFIIVVKLTLKEISVW